jgi:hypothetical protein
MQVGFAEMRVEVKQIVSSSATKTSGIVSVIVSVISGAILFFVTGMKG